MLHYLLTWILGVASKQLRLLHGRVGDSTIVVNSLSPQMSELVEDAIASSTENFDFFISILLFISFYLYIMFVNHNV